MEEQDDETQDWLNTMMNNSVSTKKWSGLGAIPGASRKSVVQLPPPDRAMRKTMILRAGTGDADVVRAKFPVIARSMPNQAMLLLY